MKRTFFYKITLLFFSILSIIINSAFFLEKKETNPFNIVPYVEEVKHFFTHELIYEPSQAFSYNNHLRFCLDRDHFTCNEFIRFLDALRLNNYILVGLDDCYEEVNGMIRNKTLYLPIGKKPFTLSLDDMSYDTKNMGIVEKLLVDEKGEICDFVEEAKNQYGYERESITILESYLKKYPDFHYNNAKMCICVNGYNGILGYRLNKYTEKIEDEENCRKLVNALKKKGYIFGCHSYSHNYINSMSAYQVQQDINKWNNLLQDIVGETSIYCFPGGIHNAKKYNDKVIINNGFKLLLCVGIDLNKSYEKSDYYKYIYRIPLDGKSIRTYSNMYYKIFEPKKVYDNENRAVKFY